MQLWTLLAPPHIVKQYHLAVLGCAANPSYNGRNILYYCASMCFRRNPSQREVPSDTFPQYLLVLVPSPILEGGSLYVLGGCALVLVA